MIGAGSSTMRAFTRLTLTTTAVVLALAALPTAYVLNGPKWGTRTVNYYINPANNDVSEAAAEAAIQAGAATWGSQSAADFRFYYMGRTNGTAAMNNGKNEVFFRNVASGSTVAETYWWSRRRRPPDRRGHHVLRRRDDVLHRIERLLGGRLHRGHGSARIRARPRARSQLRSRRRRCTT